MVFRTELHFSNDDDDVTGSDQPSSSSATLPDVTFVNVKRYNVSLLRALHKCFWLEFYSVGFLKLIADCAGFAGPLLLNKLVSFIENNEEDIRYGYGYAAGLFSATVVGKYVFMNHETKDGFIYPFILYLLKQNSSRIRVFLQF